ncbi:MAG: dephospho-CoA kinase [Fimbriimonadaceae bacterium]
MVARKHLKDRMIFCVVTGGVATGKSAFCRALLRSVESGAIAHFSCDAAANDLWSDPRMIDTIAHELGLTLDRTDATIHGGESRRIVRERVFVEPGLRLRLEAIMHPPIYRMLGTARHEAQKAGNTKVFLAEVPLYHENQSSQPADTVIVVAASRIVQSTRLMEHRNLDADTCEGLLNAQLPLELKAERADVVVWNDGSQAILEAQALTLLRDRWLP